MVRTGNYPNPDVVRSEDSSKNPVAHLQRSPHRHAPVIVVSLALIQEAEGRGRIHVPGVDQIGSTTRPYGGKPHTTPNLAGLGEAAFEFDSNGSLATD